MNLMVDVSTIPDIKSDPLRYCLSNDLVDRDGLWLEFGVWKGQTIDLISNYTDNIVYGFDTFSGLDEKWPGLEFKDMKKFDIGGVPPKTVVPIDPEVRNGPNVGDEKKFNSNVSFIVGRFEETLFDFLKTANKKISFIHIDCDLYSSCYYVLDTCLEYIKKGCVIVFDEYTNYIGWQDHEHKAFSEYVNRYHVFYEWIGMNGFIYSDLELDRKGYYENGIYSLNKNLSLGVRQLGWCV
jgi:hypothetical protein